MDAPKSFSEAKAMVKAETGKVRSSIHALIGSRALLAVLTMLMIGFGVHAAYDPTELPPIAGLSLAQAGLPPLDWGVIGEQAGQARDAAARQNVGGYVATFIDTHRELVPWFNLGGALGCALLLIVNLLAAAAKWRERPGVTIGAP